MPASRLSITAALGRGVVAGVAGTAVMTAFQKLVEMPLTGRPDSYAPASFAEKVLPIDPPTGPGRKQLNYGTHFALGTLWGPAHAPWPPVRDCGACEPQVSHSEWSIQETYCSTPHSVFISL